MERNIFEYDPEMAWPRDKVLNIDKDKEYKQVGIELESKSNQLEENWFEQREEEDENLFDSVMIREINNNNLFYGNEDNQEANDEEELPNYLEGRIWLDEDYMIGFKDDRGQRRYR